MDTDRIGASRILARLAYTEDICRLYAADQDAEATSLHATGTAVPDTARNPRTGRTHRPSNLIGHRPLGGSVDIGKREESEAGGKARNAPDEPQDVWQQ
jgi:hypothetical protein